MKRTNTDGPTAVFASARVWRVAMAPPPRESLARAWASGWGLPGRTGRAVSFRVSRSALLLDVAGLRHLAGRDLLGARERRVDRGVAGEGRREDLADGGGEALELRDRHELHADIGHRLHG